MSQKKVCDIVLVLLLFRINGINIKILGFHNNTHLLDQSSLSSEPCQTSKMERFKKIVNNF